MKVPFDWLKELVELKISEDALVRLFPLRTIALKEATDNFIELDLKGYNRADLLSMRGVAKEVAAITDSQVKFKDLAESEYIWVEQSFPSTPVSIEDEDLCNIQAVAKIEGLKVEKSPEEWVKKLNESGMRSVDIITDVTNLVMLEYGHPLHAFDVAQVKDDTINVRKARDGEEIITLDGKKRQLIASDLVLADTEKALDVAGVMGGKETEIKDSTTTILLSASLFDPVSIRKTAIRLGLYSEASKRFQHGLTSKRLYQAFDAAIRMFQEMGGKLTAVKIVGEKEDHLKKVPLSLKKVNELIGAEISKEQVEDYLTKLNFELLLVRHPEPIRPEGSRPRRLDSGSQSSEMPKQVRHDGSIAWVVTPPYYRLDIGIEEDLVEEVARMYGYEKIPAKELVGEKPQPFDQRLFQLINNLKNGLVENGLTEIITYSFFSTKVLQVLGFENQAKQVLIKLANPMSAETEYMRMSVWPNLIEVIERNMRQGYDDIAIFEIGKEYSVGQDGKPSENYSLALAITNGTDNPLAEVNQILEKVIGPLLEKDGKSLVVKEDAPPPIVQGLFHPKRFVSIFRGEEQIGGMSEVHPRILNKFGIEKRVSVLEVFLN